MVSKTALPWKPSALNDEEKRLFHLVLADYLLILLPEECLLSHSNSTVDSSNLQTTMIPTSLFTKMLLTQLLFILYLKRWPAVPCTCPCWFIFVNLSRPNFMPILSTHSHSLPAWCYL